MKRKLALGILFLSFMLGSVNIKADILTQEETNRMQSDLSEYLEKNQIKNGYIDKAQSYGFAENGLGHTPQQSVSENELPAEQALASRYDPRKEGVVSAVRKQVLGSCWAYATIAAVESNLMKKGYVDQTVDLSELQLIYFMNHKNNDPLGNYSNDIPDSSATVSELVNSGGDVGKAVEFLSKWTGPVFESQAPLNHEMLMDANGRIDYERLNQITLGQELCAKSSEWHFKGAKYCDYDIKRIGQVKELIAKYGGVGAAYFSDERYYTMYAGTGDMAYYYPYQTGDNHGIAIVGWDDGFARENFLVPPAGNGAWLVKNSWGTSYLSGDGVQKTGYFWLSYYDKNLLHVTAVDYDSKQHYENLYAYDGKNNHLIDKGRNTYLQVFQAKAYGSGQVERVDAVMLYLGADTSYEITLGVNPLVTEGRLLFPGGGTQTVSGKSDYEGFYTIDLSENPLYVANGDTYGIYVQVNAQSITGGMGVSGDVPEAVGQSYCGSNSLQLSDTYTPSIRGLTNHAAQAVLTTELALNLNTMQLKEGQYGYLEGSVFPENATVPRCGFYSTDESVAKVDEKGKVSAVGYGSCDIIATSFDGRGRDVCHVTVICSSFTIADQMLQPGEQAVLTPVFKKNYAGITREQIIWTSSDEKIAAIDETGAATGIQPGTVEIKAVLKSNPKVSATCKITVGKRVTDVLLQESEHHLYSGQTLKLAPIVQPADATMQTLLFDSSDTSIATVDETGMVKAVSGGSAVITIETADGSKLKRTVTIHVTDSVDYITMGVNPTEYTLSVGEQKELQFYVHYFNMDFLDWTCVTASDASVLDVSAVTGIQSKAGSNTSCSIKALQEGETSLTICAKDGIGATCTVHVTVRKTQTNPGETPAVPTAPAQPSGSEQTGTLPYKEPPAAYVGDEEKNVWPITVGGCKYELVKGSLKLVKAPDKKSIRVPSYIKYRGKRYKVTRIGAKAFYNKKKLQKIVLPMTITEIGKKAFYKCSRLKAVTIRATGLKKIGSAAFQKISKKAQIYVPDKKRKAYQKLFDSKCTKGAKLVVLRERTK